MKKVDIYFTAKKDVWQDREVVIKKWEKIGFVSRSGTWCTVINENGEKIITTIDVLGRSLDEKHGVVYTTSHQDLVVISRERLKFIVAEAFKQGHDFAFQSILNQIDKENG